MLGQRLKEIRKQKNISQAELAKLSKVSQTRITALETSMTRQSIHTIKLALALHVCPIWLETGVESPQALELNSWEGEILRCFRMLPKEEQEREMAFLQKIASRQIP